MISKLDAPTHPAIPADRNIDNLLVPYHILRSRFVMASGMFVADALSLVISTAVSWLLRSWLIEPPDMQSILPCIPFFILLYSLFNLAQGLYEPVGMPVEEQLRRNVTDILALGSGILAVFFITKSGTAHSRFFFFGLWFAQLLIGPLLRFLFQQGMQKAGWWGLPVGLLGDSLQRIETAIAYINVHPETGLRPVIGCVEGETSAESGKVQLLAETAFRQHLKLHHFTTVVILGNSMDLLFEKRKAYRSTVSNVIAVDCPGTLSEWYGSQFCQFGTYYGMALSNALLRRRGQMVKRLIDFILSSIGLLCVSPLFLIFTILIKAESSGPVFYIQKRRGKGGKTFGMVKFRTMFDGADLKLREYLDSNPTAKAEWDAYQKLSNDPRVTRVGRFLRKTSLDELPQLINILKGEMSLVGPRPFIYGEQELLYGETICYYDQVRPGITGLWQVSGRNHATYEGRAFFDYQYIMTWSLWKDICILFQTIPAVLHGETS